MTDQIFMSTLCLEACIGVAIMLLITISIRVSYEEDLRKEYEKNDILKETIDQIVTYAVNQNQKIKKIEKENKQLKELTAVLETIAKIK